MIFYLAGDALILGLMATALCMSFFPSGLTRITLLTLLFPLLSISLCSWMTVFGFYLRLEDIAKRALKRKITKQAVIEHSNHQHLHHENNMPKKTSTEFVNLAFEGDYGKTINDVE